MNLMDKKIFISYRRADSDAFAGRIYDRLTTFFGKSAILMDIAMIAPGDPFLPKIMEEISASSIVLVIIGDDWRSVGATGDARLLQHDDVVRLEVKFALTGNALVLPVLVGNAKMPNRSELPDDIAKLATLNAMEVRHRQFDSDVTSLIDSTVAILTERIRLRLHSHCHHETISYRDSYTRLVGTTWCTNLSPVTIELSNLQVHSIRSRFLRDPVSESTVEIGPLQLQPNYHVSFAAVTRAVWFGSWRSHEFSILARYDGVNYRFEEVFQSDFFTSNSQHELELMPSFLR